MLSNTTPRCRFSTSLSWILWIYQAQARFDKFPIINIQNVVNSFSKTYRFFFSQYLQARSVAQIGSLWNIHRLLSFSLKCCYISCRLTVLKYFLFYKTGLSQTIDFWLLMKTYKYDHYIFYEHHLETTISLLVIVNRRVGPRN